MCFLYEQQINLKTLKPWHALFDISNCCFHVILHKKQIFWSCTFCIFSCLFNMTEIILIYENKVKISFFSFSVIVLQWKWTLTDAVIIFCVPNAQPYYSQGQYDTYFPRAWKGHSGCFFFTFPPFKWLVSCPNPLITQPAEGICSNNFSDGYVWTMHIWTTSASLCSTKDKPTSKIWAKCIHSGSLLWGNWKPKNGLTTFGYLFDWHNAVVSKVFSFSKNEISSILASWKCSFKWHKWRKKALLINRVNNLHDCCGTLG